MSFSFLPFESTHFMIQVLNNTFWTFYHFFLLFSIFCFLFPVSCFLFPVSCFLFPISCFLFPVSCLFFSLYNVVCISASDFYPCWMKGIYCPRRKLPLAFSCESSCYLIRLTFVFFCWKLSVFNFLSFYFDPTLTPTLTPTSKKMKCFICSYRIYDLFRLSFMV